MTITSIQIRMGSFGVVATGGAYLNFGDRLQTFDLPYATYSAYSTYSNIGAYCTKDILTWLQSCASQGTIVRMAPHVVSSAQALTNTVQIAAKMTMTVTITYVAEYQM